MFWFFYIFLFDGLLVFYLATERIPCFKKYFNKVRLQKHDAVELIGVMLRLFH